MSGGCFFCNKKLDSSVKNTVFNVFKTIVYPLQKPASELIADLLEVQIDEENIHSNSLCKTCFSLVNEFAKLEARAAELRTSLFESYSSTIQTLSTVEEGKKRDNEKLSAILDASGGTVKEYFIHTDDGTLKRSQMIVVSDGEEVEWADVLEEDNEPGEIIEERIEDDVGEFEEYIEDDFEKDAFEPADLSQILEVKGNTHTCKLCPNGIADSPFSVETSSVNLMAFHIKHEHDIVLFLCDVCGIGYHDKGALLSHMEEHEKESGEDLSCDQCPRTFDNLRILRIHKRTHSSLKKGSWVCNVCNKAFASRNMLEEHMNVHLGLRPYKCEMCPKDFTSKYTLKSHLKTHEDRDRVYTCSICTKGFMTPQTLIAHEKTHSASRAYSCHVCAKSFASQRSLEVHGVVHSGEKPFVCSHCDKAFARKAEVKDHERTHTGERPFKCDMCSHAFSQRSNLLSHRRVTHYDDRRYQCGECTKTFKRRRLLDYHVKAVHTHEKPYSCNVCDAAFIYPEHYKKHLRIHTGLKPYKCEVCDKGFNSKDNRNAHRFVHSDKKPYECSTCRAGFMRKPLLFNHMQQANHMQNTIVVNSPNIDHNGDFVEDSQVKSLENWEDEDSETIDENDQIVDLEGNVLSIVGSLEDSETMMATINEQGQLVNEDGQIISENARALIVDDSSVAMIEENSQIGEVKYVQLRSTDTDEITEIGVKIEPT